MLRDTPAGEFRVASSTIAPYLRAASDLGIDPSGPLSEVGLTIDAIEIGQNRIGYSQCLKLLERLIELAHDHCFGLRSANYVEMSSYDINGYISVNCASLLEAIVLTSKYYGILSDRRVLHVFEHQQQVTCQWRVQEPLDAVARNFADNLLATYMRFGRMNLGLQEGLVRATFRHSAPRDAETRRLYETTFDCPLLFNQEHYSIVFDREFARYTRIPRADTLLRDTLISHAQTRIRDILATPPLTYQVKTLIRQLFDETVPTRESVADRLRIGSRTLQRQLLSEGSSYKDAFNAVRLELALHYLRDSTLSLDDIAEKLGFSETRSLHRSYKQWTGETLGASRARITA